MKSLRRHELREHGVKNLRGKTLDDMPASDKPITNSQKSKTPKKSFVKQLVLTSNPEVSDKEVEEDNSHRRDVSVGGVALKGSATISGTFSAKVDTYS